MTKLRYGIIGCGVINTWHAEAIGATEQAELVAVCDIVPERAKAAADRWGVTGYTSRQDLLNNRNIDVVTIATPSGLHAEHAIEAIKAGKHVIVEKPIDINLAKADAIIATAREAGVHITCVSNTRYGKGYQQLHKWLDEGKLG